MAVGLYSENEKILCERYFDEEIFYGGAGLCRNNGRIQSIFSQKTQASVVVNLL